MVGLAIFVGVVVFTYLVAVSSARLLVHASRSLVPEFVLPLVPIAFAYMVAHYFSLFVIQGQFMFTLISDPFGRGWDLFGTVDFAPNLAIVSPETVWYVQVAALVVGPRGGARHRPRPRGLAVREQTGRPTLPVPDARD